MKISPPLKFKEMGLFGWIDDSGIAHRFMDAGGKPRLSMNDYLYDITRMVRTNIE